MQPDGRALLLYARGSVESDGVCTAETVPEDKARELQAVQVDVDA